MEWKFLVVCLLLVLVFVCTCVPMPMEENEEARKNESESKGLPTRLIYQSFGQIRETLENPQVLQAVPEISELNSFHSSFTPSSLNTGRNRPFPFVVIEGLDGSGKFTVCQGVSEKLRFQVITPFPPSLKIFQSLVSGLNDSVKRAYKAGGNYIATREMMEIWSQPTSSLSSPCTKDKGVIMDRFWSTNAAIGIAKQLMKYGTDSVSSSDYVWPFDLPLPDLVIFLGVTEENRQRRLRHGNMTLDQTEQELNDSAQFRQLVIDTYKKVRGPKTIQVDANNSDSDAATTEENINALVDRVCDAIRKNLQLETDIQKMAPVSGIW